jgi:soluble lytic murein transglycosylase
MKCPAFAGLLLAAVCFSDSAAADRDFLKARETYAEGNLKLFNKFAAKVNEPLLSAYIDYWRMGLQLRSAREEDIRAFTLKYPDSPLANKLRGDWLRQQGRLKDWPAVLNLYPSLVKPDVELTCYSLRARLDRGDPVRTEAAGLWMTRQDMPSACDPLFEQIIEEGVLTDEALWGRIRLALSAGNVGVARHVASQLRQPQGITPEAIDYATKYPSAALSPELNDPQSRGGCELQLFALSRLARSDFMRAHQLWQAFQGRMPDPDYRLGWAWLAMQAARNHYPVALAWYGLAGDARLNDEMLAWKARAGLRSGDWSVVLQAIDAMDEEERSYPAWRYWKARALKSLGRLFEANRILAPLSGEEDYYGRLAEEELGAVLQKRPATHKVNDAEVSAVERLAGIKRALRLRQLGLPEASSEWAWAIRGFDDRQRLAAAELARREEWYDQAIRTAESTERLHDFELRFLTPYQEMARAHAREHGLDEAWVYGLMRQESRFVNRARSNVGASGVMQIMPATAQWIARQLGIRRHRSSDLYSLDTNIRMGTWYMKYVLDKLDGHPVLATAAYNAGPSRAQRWRGTLPLEGAIYVETIPFLETRDYVRKVMYNAMHYADIFGHQTTALRARLGIIGPIPGATPEQGDDLRPDLEMAG